MDYNFIPKNGICTGKNEKQKVTIDKKYGNRPALT